MFLLSPSLHLELNVFSTMAINSMSRTWGFRRVALAAVGLLVAYLLGYGVLCLLGYFDLVALPWAPHRDNWLYQIYRPLEWLRHLL